ncbi:hypothetical protein HCJ93_25065 [Streptomyces sp. SBST2-5]|uniref:Uncharacterized protein n=1 Tax=Streptomyces composti TaxID=2720025 RepID=A0ABX1AHA9_9ACTN|nr:hypothetical protein [Streptomyces composti]NJP53249.1 hypothetical protein [Streptomyces composti]
MKGDPFTSRRIVQPATAPGMAVENATCVRYGRPTAGAARRARATRW